MEWGWVWGVGPYSSEWRRWRRRWRRWWRRWRRWRWRKWWSRKWWRWRRRWWRWRWRWRRRWRRKWAFGLDRKSRLAANNRGFFKAVFLLLIVEGWEVKV